MKQRITYGEKYDPAMKITDQEEADRYFEECVQQAIGSGLTREEAEQIERTNLGYWAGYYDTETRLRVEKLFRCAHPVFGKAADGVPTAEDAFPMGVKVGMDAKGGAGASACALGFIFSWLPAPAFPGWDCAEFMAFALLMLAVGFWRGWAERGRRAARERQIRRPIHIQWTFSNEPFRHGRE